MKGKKLDTSCFWALQDFLMLQNWLIPIQGNNGPIIINVLDQIRVLVGNFVKFNKRTGPNKHTGAKLLPQKCNFL